MIFLTQNAVLCQYRVKALCPCRGKWLPAQVLVSFELQAVLQDNATRILVHGICRADYIFDLVFNQFLDQVDRLTQTLEQAQQALDAAVDRMYQ